MSDPESPGCTCHLEPAFFTDQEDDSPVNVVDAEGEIVATCPTRAYAELVRAALDAFEDDDFHACVEHRRLLPLKHGRRQ